MDLFPELFNNKQSTHSIENISSQSAPDWSIRENIRTPSSEIIKTRTQPSIGQLTNYPVSPIHTPHPQPLSNNLVEVKVNAKKLNYMAIHEELEGHSVRGKLLLMQALRWVRFKLFFLQFNSLFLVPHQVNNR